MKINIKFSILFILIGFACNQAKPSQDTSTNDVDTISELTITDNKDTLRSSLKKYFVKENGWIQAHNVLSSDQSGIYIYFQAPDDVATNLRMRIQYPGSNAYKFNIDGKQYIYKANRNQQQSNDRFVDNESISWFDERVKKDDLKFLEALASSTNTQLYLDNGVITINNEIKKKIQQTLDYFEALDGQLPRTNMVNIRR